jgi:hypothetical protein
MRFKHLLFQLVPSTPHIDETESGLWPTIQTTDAHGHDYQYQGGNRNKKTMTLAGMAKLYPTMTVADVAGGPTKPNSKHPHSPKLAQVVKRTWPTARSSDYKGSSMHVAKKGRNPQTNSLVDAVEFPAETNGRLNPNWVEWLMGFPIGWTDLDA